MLLYNNINPFTQDEMFMDDVLKYNETEEAKSKVGTFIKNKEAWINHKS